MKYDKGILPSGHEEGRMEQICLGVADKGVKLLAEGCESGETGKRLGSRRGMMSQQLFDGYCLEGGESNDGYVLSLGHCLGKLRGIGCLRRAAGYGCGSGCFDGYPYGA